jgi:Transposase DDE domain
MGQGKAGVKVTKSGFKGALRQMVPTRKLTAICARHAPVARTQPQLSAAQLVESLVYHQLQPAGPLGQHAAELHGVKLSESAHAQRRQGLPFELFDEVLTTALRPLADATRQPECFFHDWRVVGIDGTEWSVTNTPAILAQLPKAATRRFRAAFAKLRLVTAVELGVHHPLAAAVGRVARGEQALAAELWAKLPDHSLVIVDRLFGSPATLWQALTAWQKRPMAFLARVKANIKAEVVERLADGSALVEVPVRRERRQVGTLRMREVRAAGTTVDGRTFALRFWTSLLNPATYPAETLARHYVERWEQELYYRELKLDVRGSDVLASHTVETALQELAALVLATAVVAQVRVAAAEGLGVPPRRVSFLKVLLATQQLWQSFAWAGGTLTAAQCRRILAHYHQRLRDTALLPERRARSCPRVLRQTSSAWPRKLLQPSHQGRSTLRVVLLP